MHRPRTRHRAAFRNGVPIVPHALVAAVIASLMTPAAADIPFADDRDAIREALSDPTVDGGATSKGLFGDDASETTTVRVMREGETKGTRAIGVVERRSDAPSVNLRVEFAFDSAELDPDSRDLLGELGAALKDPALADEPISINGHTDSAGAEDYNLELSYRRAESVRAYLAGELDVDAGRLDVLGFGESVPLNDNASEAERAVNRRVEIERLR